MDATHDATQDVPEDGGVGADVDLLLDADTDLAELRAALEGAGDLSLDERLVLLKRTESTIARALEGLDGL